MGRVPLEEVLLLPLVTELEGVVLLLHLDGLDLIPSVLPGHDQPCVGLLRTFDDHLLQNKLGTGADDVELLEEGPAQVGVGEMARRRVLVGEEGLHAGLGQLGGRSGPTAASTAIAAGTAAANDQLGKVRLAEGAAALGAGARRGKVGEGAVLAEDAVAPGEVAGRREGFGAAVARQHLRWTRAGGGCSSGAALPSARRGTGGHRRGERGPASRRRRRGGHGHGRTAPHRRDGTSATSRGGDEGIGRHGCCRDLASPCARSPVSVTALQPPVAFFFIRFQKNISVETVHREFQPISPQNRHRCSSG